jgi:hypothetical protein
MNAHVPKHKGSDPLLAIATIGSGQEHPSCVSDGRHSDKPRNEHHDTTAKSAGSIEKRQLARTPLCAVNLPN